MMRSKLDMALFLARSSVERSMNRAPAMSIAAGGGDLKPEPPGVCAPSGR
jgi:hypothetical protein